MEMIHAFMNLDADLKIRDSLAFTPLHYAAEFGHLEIIQYFWMSGLSVDDKAMAFSSQSAITPLHLAAGNGNLDVIQFLVTQVGVNTRTSSGLTPLHYAAHKGQLDALKLLIASGADVNEANNLGVDF